MRTCAIIGSIVMAGNVVAAGKPSTSIFDWIQGPPPIQGRPSYTAFHAETRVDNFDPQLLPTDKGLSGNVAWRSVVSNVQPFLSVVDQAAKKIYWRKDFFNTCSSTDGCGFYGEVMSFNHEFVHLRMESFPVFGHGIDDGKTWDIRPDKFRLVSNSSQGKDARPGGVGRIFAPIHITNGWHVEQTFDTYACLSYADFRNGTCVKYQTAFKDSVSLEIWKNFSTVFDGEEAGYPASEEYKHFDAVIVISQIMGDGQARERYFLGGRFDRASGRFVGYGFVRWDDSARSKDGSYVVVARAVGLKRSQELPVTADGMIARGQVDVDINSAGLNLFHEDSLHPAADHQLKACPEDGASDGRVHLPPMQLPRDQFEVEDQSGYATSSGGWIGVCYAPNHAREVLTKATGCPQANTRGTFFVSEALVKRSSVGGNSELQSVRNDWVALCATTASDHSTYLSAASGPSPCTNGGASSAGRFRSFRDCYDASGNRCDRSASTPVWITVCNRN